VTSSGGATGYAHPDYAESLAEFGTPRFLAGSGATLLERTIPGCTARDAMGCYPLFACTDWSKLEADLEAAGRDWICLSVVTDPFGRYDRACLARSFPSWLRAFKEHHVVDLAVPEQDRTSDHHRRNARRARRVVEVETCAEPTRFLGEWIALYAHLVRRHGIRGIPAFSARSFEGQLRVPGLVAFRAEHAGETVGMLLWYVQGDVGYYHLGAYDDAGYELRASFALFQHAIEHFRDAGLRWLDLGAGAGTTARADDGLGRFKQGWSTGTRTAWLGGRIFDPEHYARLARERGAEGVDFFPAYRHAEWQE
jgi:hypothetical protein